MHKYLYYTCDFNNHFSTKYIYLHFILLIMKRIEELKSAIVVDVERKPMNDFISSYGIAQYGYIITFDNGDKAHYGSFTLFQDSFIVGTSVDYKLTTITSSIGHIVHSVWPSHSKCYENFKDELKALANKHNVTLKEHDSYTEDVWTGFYYTIVIDGTDTGNTIDEILACL